MSADLQEFLEQIYCLHRDRRGGHERPHKPVLLLAVMDLIERGVIKENHIGFTDELRQRFKEIFEIVRRSDDKPTPENPFFHLGREDFWNVIDENTGEALYIPGQAGGTPNIGQLKTAYAEFSPLAIALLNNPRARNEIREGILSRYFPWKAVDVRNLLNVADTVSSESEVHTGNENKPARDGAFAKIVKQVYDYRCAACGLRMRLDAIHFVDAAHLIPFAQSHNDHPTNGMALCKNHHWALDQHLIAPGTDMIWRVSDKLDDRISDHGGLLEIKGRGIIPPMDKKFIPARESLQYRMDKLL